MRRVLSLALLPVLALAACGDDTADPAADPTVPPPATTAPGDDARYAVPEGADDVVVSIEYVGGFAPAETQFSQLPVVLATGAGRLFSLGPQIAIYPGPLLPNVQYLDLGDAGLQDLLALADEHGLLQDRAYDLPTNVADAADTVVTIRVGAATYVHRAYALGLDGTEDGPRRELQAFVEGATALAYGETREFEPERYLVRATPVDDLSDYDLEPTVVAWPVEVEIDLATASECVEVPADVIGPTFAEANQLTFFEQDGATYRLTVKPALPGADC